MEDRFANLDVEQIAAARLSNRIGEGSRIIRCAAAGSELLRIAEFVLDQHVRRFQQNKMGRGGGRRQQSNCDNGEAYRIFHLKALPCCVRVLNTGESITPEEGGRRFKTKPRWLVAVLPARTVRRRRPSPPSRHRPRCRSDHRAHPPARSRSPS